METFIAFLIAAAVTLFFVRRYVRQLTSHSTGAKAATAAPERPGSPCPRCNKPVAAGAAFCAACGAAMSMWNVHRAQQVAPSAAAKTGVAQPVINASLCIGCGSCVDVCPETGTLEMVNHKAILAHPERCTGHAKCKEVCPTQAISLTIGGAPQTVRVPLVSEIFESNVSGVFIVGELSGFGLIKTAINEGKLVVDHVRQRVKRDEAAPDEHYDVAIVGAGPAGISATLSAHQAGLKYITFEQGEIASTIRNYPRQKFVMAEPIEIPMYGNLYMGDGTKEALLSVWESIIANTGIKINTNEPVEQIQRNSVGFHVRTPKGDYRATNVVLALGRRGTPRKLGVPGEDLAKVTYRLIETGEYSNQDLLVVGGGDSAIEAAIALSRSGTNRVTLSYRGDEFTRARARNREFLEAAEKDRKLTVLLKSNVAEIRPSEVLIQCGPERKTIPNDFVFVLAGGESPEGFLSKVGIQIVEKAVAASKF